MDALALAEQLRPVLGEDAVITDHQRLRTYECDGLTHYKVIPALVVLAESTEHVATVVRACAARGIPFVARGSGTGLSGGALPHAEGVLIVMSKMRCSTPVLRRRRERPLFWCRRSGPRIARSRLGYGNSAKIAARSMRSDLVRSNRRSTWLRVASMSLSYRTPDGQAVTQAMQPRQASKCSTIEGVSGSP